MNQDWMNALMGGALIGLSVSLMLLFNGRVTGISGIVNGILTPAKGDTLWRVLFVAGMVFGGFVLQGLNPNVFAGNLDNPLWTTVVAGLLVGFGTVMGSGCTSGHGVCGISRMSVRSLVATITFIGAGVIAVLIFKKLGLL
jgi:uncharacterized membrane protein YedE/YeeE